MTYRGQCAFCGCIHSFRQKNKRTKVMTLNCTDVCSSELDKHSNIQCWASAMQGVSTLLLYRRTERSGCIRFLKTEEHKNKRAYWILKCLFKRAWRAFVHSMWYTFGAGSSTSFVGKERRSGCLIPFVPFKNAVLALQILCMMGMWLYRQKLAYAWTDRWTSSAFLCSFVLISFYLSLCALVSIVLSLRWDPWSSPGMTVSGHCAVVLWMYTF